MGSTDVWKLLTQTYEEWNEDNVPRLGAALAFYTALSLAPLLVISLRIAAFVFGDDAARGEIESQMQSLIGKQGAGVVETMLENANQTETGTLATTLSLLTLLLGASGVFGQLQDSLNTIWEVEPKPGRGVIGFLRDRFFSMAMVMGVAFLLIVSLLVSATLAFLSTYTTAILGNYEIVSHGMNLIISLITFTVLFALLFKFVPDAQIAWNDVWWGAFITAVLFAIGKLGIGLYLGGSSFASSYGVAGSLIVLLVWVYYSAQIVFLGAEFTQVYANHFGQEIRPTEHAQAVTEERRAEEGLTPEKDHLP